MPTYLTKIDEMRSLARDWDSYGADPPNPATLQDTARFLAAFVEAAGLPEPQVAATRVGGVGAFWQIGTHELEMEFEPGAEGTRVTYVVEDLSTGETVNGEFRLSATRDVRPFALHALVRAVRESNRQVAV